MYRNTISRCIAPVLALLSGSAAAHSLDAPAGGLAAGLAHPFLGLDHLLALLAVGLWATQHSGRARWAIPGAFAGAFAGATAVGTALAAAGIVLPAAEAAIAVSVVILGLLVAARHAQSLPAAMALAGAFAVFHGFAHGIEMQQAASPLAAGAGFVLGTALLHAAGFLGGVAGRRAVPYAGAAIAASGLALILGL
ncbi:membrane-bound hydrogenase component hupE [Thiobacillus denitrificans ATCC 25259]|uniref:Membrane-bound hydrogenase component hupE n=1 Tax=Thiobacillus denitrificans (strain ATCC 25259 / T1) TaxID=292415 RepID=Q3SJ43_THIDA|nr:HupE/UreJ family protein [Thiobacillus denitrificans]AAZ97327.1 membrane-bound hydrogenase component hupE [Thiobacillus denitrificans ATCC 25259]